MSYLGYKNKTFMAYKKEQERVKMWKAEQARKRKKLRQWKNLSTTFIIQLVVVALIIVFYGVFAMGVMADTKKLGDGPFVMAISYTDSYDDLQYIANFPNCDKALDYYNTNCIDAKIMMCQAEARMYMPLNHDVNNTFSSFDFEVNDSQSCGFVGVQKPKFTEVQ